MVVIFTLCGAIVQVRTPDIVVCHGHGLTFLASLPPLLHHTGSRV
jgi:hypothetical protein